MSDDKLDFFACGMDTTRLPSTQVDSEAERRGGSSRVARTKLAAFLVAERGGMAVVTADAGLASAAAEDFSLLIDMLGLDPTPPARPGVCRRPACGAPLSITAAVLKQRRVKPFVREGFCSPACWADAEHPPGHCVRCGRELPAWASARNQGRRDTCFRQACNGLLAEVGDV